MLLQGSVCAVPSVSALAGWTALSDLSHVSDLSDPPPHQQDTSSHPGSTVSQSPPRRPIPTEGNAGGSPESAGGFGVTAKNLTVPL